MKVKNLKFLPWLLIDEYIFQFKTRSYQFEGRKNLVIKGKKQRNLDNKLNRYSSSFALSQSLNFYLKKNVSFVKSKKKILVQSYFFNYQLERARLHNYLKKEIKFCWAADFENRKNFIQNLVFLKFFSPIFSSFPHEIRKRIAYFLTFLIQIKRMEKNKKFYQRDFHSVRFLEKTFLLSWSNKVKTIELVLTNRRSLKRKEESSKNFLERFYKNKINFRKKLYHLFFFSYLEALWERKSYKENSSGYLGSSYYDTLESLIRFYYKFVNEKKTDFAKKVVLSESIFSRKSSLTKTKLWLNSNLFFFHEKILSQSKKDFLIVFNQYYSKRILAIRTGKLIDRRSRKRLYPKFAQENQIEVESESLVELNLKNSAYVNSGIAKKRKNSLKIFSQNYEKKLNSIQYQSLTFKLSFQKILFNFYLNLSWTGLDSSILSFYLKNLNRYLAPFQVFNLKKQKFYLSKICRFNEELLFFTEKLLFLNKDIKKKLVKLKLHQLDIELYRSKLKERFNKIFLLGFEILMIKDGKMQNSLPNKSNSETYRTEINSTQHQNKPLAIKDSKNETRMVKLANKSNKVIESEIAGRKNAKIADIKAQIERKKSKFEIFSNYFSFSSLILPSKEKIRLHLQELSFLIKMSKGKTQEELIYKLAPKINEWSQKYRNISIKRILNHCDYLTSKMIWKWACRKHPKKTKVWIKEKYFISLNKKTWIFASSDKVKEGYLCLPCHNETELVQHIPVVKGKSIYGGKFKTKYWCKRLFLSNLSLTKKT
uniref:hypothetical protein n=1 Tax=Parallela transversalis TaxID=163324 RepID=UPI0010C2A3DD|nr:hypothetical protein [Parallela transversalis]AYQ22848.1 hypothetical protein [Parallela transversalis]